MIDDFPGKKKTKAENMSGGYIALQTIETAAGGKSSTVSLFPLQWTASYMLLDC